MKTITLQCQNCNQSFKRNLSEHKKNLRKNITKTYCCIQCRQQALVKYTKEKGYRFQKGHKSSTQFKKGHKNEHALKGEESNFAVLTNQNVLDIRQQWRDGTTVKQLCKWSGMSESAIRSIIRYKSWKHLP